ncbi:TIGR03084 family metal-binding protein [Actinophytocola gossypii]|uniref:TIGR03084 family protein n=1 Tax=Actinophytocola gossypii TaxID=2812003 RepID=A0ABT2J909_9PSEU|nr:TIGR03084 family metal-binding protein [Actinophytocola gossypii]MCT2583764.1 TIGR03084 family protein [Actinophytocola gossypii]
MTQRDVIADLTAEAEAVDALVAGIDAADWARPTPAPGWTVANQIAHLAFIFRLAGTAAAAPERFAAMTAKAAENFEGAVNGALREFDGDSPEVLLGKWRTERDTAIEALAAVPPDQVVPWLVRPLPPTVLACAGTMECFGHGQDIADALGVARERTDRLWHLAWFATLTWDFGYQSRGLTAPDVQFRYELTAPSGDLWEFGPPTAEQRITGSATDFCLLVTRRRHRDDLDVKAVGDDADAWLDLAQAYRGPAGQGRRPGQFSS